MYHVDFLNKNTMRNYPLRGEAPVVSNAGVLLPTALFSAMQFSMISAYTNIFISRIYVSGSFINILVGSTYQGQLTYIGSFDANITEDYQVVQMTSLISSGYGSLTIGKKEVLADFQGYHDFISSVSRVEDSLITYVLPPALTAIACESHLLTGRVLFEYSNVRQIASPINIQLEVINKEIVKADNDTSTVFGNCPTTPIGDINGVVPDENGNIDIFGISPVQISVDAASGILHLSVPNITRADLCVPDKRIPPYKADSSYPAIESVTAPEWHNWAQYKNYE